MAYIILTAMLMMVSSPLLIPLSMMTVHRVANQRKNAPASGNHRKRMQRNHSCTRGRPGVGSDVRHWREG